MVVVRAGLVVAAVAVWLPRELPAQPSPSGPADVPPPVDDESPAPPPRVELTPPTPPTLRPVTNPATEPTVATIQPRDLPIRTGWPRPPSDWIPPRGLRLVLSDLSLIRLNPIGLETRARFGVQKRLYRSDKRITRQNFAFVGVFPKLNPASAQLGVGGELQPASMFNLRVFGEVQRYFGTVGFLQSFRSANANFSPETLGRLRDDPARPPQDGTLYHAAIHPLVQLRVGPIALRSLIQLDYWAFDLRPGDNLVYEPTFDTLLPDDGWTLTTDTDALYVGRPNLAVGLRHTLVRPLYGDDHFEGSADRDAYDGDNAHQRLGLFAAYTLRDRGPSGFNKPTILMIVSWYLSHRWRAGTPSMFAPGTSAEDHHSRALPYFLVGFAFESDLLAIQP